MYRVHQLTPKENGKIIRKRWSGTRFYFDVFETQRECDFEEERRNRIFSEALKCSNAYCEKSY